MFKKVLIVEDDIVQAINIEQMLDELGGYEIVATCRDGLSVMKAIEANTPDLLLMDIKINGSLNGVEIAHNILEKSIPIVFMTQYPDDDFFHQASTLPQTAFLVKPFHKFTLASVLYSLIGKKTTPIRENADNKLIYIRVGNKREIINPDDIMWVESNRNYCTIRTFNNSSFIIKRSLKSLYAILPENMFVFIHKSYLVRKSLIKRIDLKNQTVLVGADCFPLGRHYIKDLKDLLLKLG